VYLGNFAHTQKIMVIEYYSMFLNVIEY